MQSKEPAFKVCNLSVCYQNKFALKDISLQIDDTGKMVAVVGPNGAGKSSFIKACVGILKKHSGTVFFWGKKIDVVRSKISYIPQRSNIDFSFPITVKEVVMMGFYSRAGLWSKPSDDDHAYCNRCLEDLGLLSQTNSNMSQLSGGQQQRVLIARSLMQKSDLYFLDEPFIGLDAFSFNKIMSIFKELCKEGKTIIIVHHDLLSVKTYFDEVIMINRRVIAYGSVESVFTEKNIQFSYGGFHRVIEEAEKICCDLSRGVD